MRQLGKFALAFAVVALCALPASAQGQRGQRGQGQGRGGFGGGLMLLSNKSVQEELKLENGQTEKIAALATKNRENFGSLRDLSQEARREKLTAITAENDKEIASILKPEQVARLHQIENQTGGANALLSERNAEKLKLTDDQKSKVREVLASSREKMGELRGQFQNDREGAMKKMQEIRAETNKSALAVLTDDQKKTWEELTGAPFEVKFEGGRRPGA
jgi:Spy/CpxP family protein refolding chaperone